MKVNAAFFSTFFFLDLDENCLNHTVFRKPVQTQIRLLDIPCVSF